MVRPGPTLVLLQKMSTQVAQDICGAVCLPGDSQRTPNWEAMGGLPYQTCRSVWRADIYQARDLGRVLEV